MPQMASLQGMEMRGVEPLSENPSAKTSSITAYVLAFPRYNAHKQALSLGSFIKSFLPAKLKTESASQSRRR